MEKMNILTDEQIKEMEEDYKEVLKIVDGNIDDYEYLKFTWGSARIIQEKMIQRLSYIYSLHFNHSSSYGMKYDSNDIVGSLNAKAWAINVTAIKTWLNKWDYHLQGFKL